MDNYKIKVKDEAESKEAQELFFELGYRWNHNGKKYFKVSSGEILAYSRGVLFQCGDDTGKELTLPQLRDLVVLKRGDVKDANVSDGTHYKLYQTSDNRLFIYAESANEWVISDLSGNPETLAKLKPITQDPALISGAEAKLAWAHGKDVQTATLPILHEQSCWMNLPGGFGLDIFDDNQDRVFRLKPQTIKLELEIPAPYKAKIGGRDDTSFVLNVGRHQYCYKTEEDYTKARDALEAVFDAALRGTNS